MNPTIRVVMIITLLAVFIVAYVSVNAIFQSPLPCPYNDPVNCDRKVFYEGVTCAEVLQTRGSLPCSVEVAKCKILLKSIPCKNPCIGFKEGDTKGYQCTDIKDNSVWDDIKKTYVYGAALTVSVHCILSCDLVKVY